MSLKILSIFGLILGTLICILALYLQLSIVPKFDVLDGLPESHVFYTTANDIYLDALKFKLHLAYTVLLGGGITFLFQLILFIKGKGKISLIGSILSLIAFVIGMIYGAHLFT